ncbi:MAG: hypothetical protein AUK63_748 [bacterium P3]|nr:MAG: hypothetical protein AUK63_748 [bacterium P3]KWW41816.1 MAG: hypothetical protein F083_744 [bacterium F083]
MTREYTHLYIIGNGFDIFTGLKTRYIDFRWWLENNYIFVYEALTSVYGFDGDWWFDFENQLGKLDINKYISDYTPKYANTHELYEVIRSKREFEKKYDLPHNVLFSDPCSSRLNGLFDILQYCFEKWVFFVMNRPISIKYTNIETRSSFFVNFNYTDTLECFYHIPEERVFHIHGRAIKRDRLIFGHNKHQFGSAGTSYEYEKVSEVLNRYEKNPYMNIPRDLNLKIEGVKNIHILGLSFSKIDIPYIEWIVRNTSDCNWEISWYSENDMNRIKDFIMENPVIKDRVKLIQIKEKKE